METQYLIERIKQLIERTPQPTLKLIYYLLIKAESQPD